VVVQSACPIRVDLASLCIVGLHATGLNHSYEIRFSPSIVFVHERRKESGITSGGMCYDICNKLRYLVGLAGHGIDSEGKDHKNYKYLSHFFSDRTTFSGVRVRWARESPAKNGWVFRKIIDPPRLILPDKRC